VRAKQRFCYHVALFPLACPSNSNGLGGGFAPLHLSRSMLPGKVGETKNKQMLFSKSVWCDNS
jgi:hypothetical protein